MVKKLFEENLGNNVGSDLNSNKGSENTNRLEQDSMITKGGFFRFFAGHTYNLMIAPWASNTAARKYFENEMKRDLRKEREGKLTLPENLGCFGGIAVGGLAGFAEIVAILKLSDNFFDNVLYGVVPMIITNIINRKYELKRDEKYKGH